jgi:hypothetical protein
MRLARLLLVLLLAACQPTPAPSPTPVLPLFYDDFSQNRGLWEIFSEDNASAKIANGQMDMTINQPSSVALAMSALNVSDFDLSVSSTLSGGGLTNSYGLVFRYLDNENFYRLDLTGDGLWGVSRHLNDQWVSIVDLKTSPAIQPGLAKTNVIRILAHNSSFMFYANGTLLGSISDNNLPVGRIGLFASTFNDPTVQVGFDNVRVVKP